MKNCEEEAISDICKAFLSKLFTLGANFLSIIDRYKLSYIYSNRQFASIDTFFPTFSPIRWSRRERKREGEGKNIEAEGVPFAPCSFDTRTLNDKCLARFACHSRMHSRCTRVHLLDEIYAVKVWNR